MTKLLHIFLVGKFSLEFEVDTLKALNTARYLLICELHTFSFDLKSMPPTYSPSPKHGF